jgi:predicted ribosomally synthesized peptide with SipW-like signal peptide
MRTKILTSLIIIALASALAGGATYAVFSHREAIEGNLIATGDLQFDLVGEPFNVENMKPGDVEVGYIEIINTGTLDMIYRVLINGAANPADFANQLLITVTLNPSDYTSPQDGQYARYGGRDMVLAEKMPLSYALSQPFDNEDAAFSQNQPLRPGYMAIYKVEVELPFETGNEYENASFQGDVIVEGTQFDHQTPGNVQY